MNCFMCPVFPHFACPQAQNKGVSSMEPLRELNIYLLQVTEISELVFDRNLKNSKMSV